jgi:anti-anti-sigma factor
MMSAAIKLDDLTIFNALAMKEVIEIALAEKNLEFDLPEVGEIDSSGLQLLMAARKQANKNGQELVFHSVSQPVLELVNQYGLTESLGMSA